MERNKRTTQAGFIISVELLLAATLLVLGIIVGLVTVRDATFAELKDFADMVTCAAEPDCEFTDTVDTAAGDLSYFTSLPASSESGLTSPPPPPPPPGTFPVSFNGALTLNSSDNAIIDFYMFEVTTAGTFSFQMDAAGVGFSDSDLDAFVFIADDPDGDANTRAASEFNNADTDDDTGTGTDALLTIFLDVGTYLIGAAQSNINTPEYVSGVNGNVTTNSTDNLSYQITIDSTDGVGTVTPPTP